MFWAACAGFGEGGLIGQRLTKAYHFRLYGYYNDRCYVILMLHDAKSENE